MQTLTIERMERDNPDSLYRAIIGNTVTEGLTYQEAIELMIQADERRNKSDALRDRKGISRVL